MNLALSHTSGNFDLRGCEEAPGTTTYGVLSVLGQLAFALSFDSVTKTTSALAWQLCQHQIEHFLQTVKSRITELEAPLSLAVIWLNILGQLRAHRVMARRDGVSRNEMDIGIHWSRNGDKVKTDFKISTFGRLHEE